MKQWTIRQRILCSFGIVLIVMLAMAIVTFEQLGGIDRDAKSQQEDSMPGLYYATAMRAAWFENYTVTQRLIYVDADPESVKRDHPELGYYAPQDNVQVLKSLENARQRAEIGFSGHPQTQQRRGLLIGTFQAHEHTTS